MTRKMATIRRIEEVKAIPNADKIVAYRVGGWWVVDSIGKYVVGDLVVYAEPDSFIPSTIAPFLTKPGHYAKTFEGVEGERLRTVSLRKQISQGLLLPLSMLTMVESELFEGLDVSFPLGIVKYEAPAEFMAADAKGMFPSFIPRTDQERIQNLSSELAEWRGENLTWSLSEKCEGSSFTAFIDDGEFNVCSRNLMLKENADNTFWATANTYDLKNKMTVLGRNIAIQAELLGPGIQGNIYKLSKHMLAVFDIFDIDAKQYMSPVECKAMIEQLGLTSVPVLKSAFVLTTETVEDLLKMADGQSVMGIVGCKREGVVWKCNERRVSFKAISNAYLLGQ